MKPSERIKEIFKSLKILDGQNPNEPHFETMSFVEKAILQYLDELKNGTEIEQRTNKPINK